MDKNDARRCTKEEREFIKSLSLLAAGVKSDVVYSGLVLMAVHISAHRFDNIEDAKKWFVKMQHDMTNTSNINWGKIKAGIEITSREIGNA